jgi:hypothetical protein
MSKEQRAIGLAAVQTAARRHSFVGLRPRGETREKSAGHLIGAEPPNGPSINHALESAQQTWPETESLEVFGADQFTPTEATELNDNWLIDGEAASGLFEGILPYGYFEYDPGPNEQAAGNQA